MQLSTLATGLGATLLASVTQCQYVSYTTYDASNFFDAFGFFNQPDPTHGFVEYVNADVAFAEGLAKSVDSGGFYMGVDTTTMNPLNGRKSVRLTSHESFTHGLFIIDLAHMPSSQCGAWPAFWAFGDNWPSSGEIDIIEGVNNQQSNSVTLHTSPGCVITNEGSLDTTFLHESHCGAGNGNTGCGQSTADNQNYGDGFNAIGGGVYAMEWTSDHIAVWFFPRTGIPADVAAGTPTPASWGQPTAKFNGGAGCDIDSYFKENNLVFDTTFCGDWAGAVWGANPECSALAPTCNEYVANNPAAFAEAYWEVNHIQVYQTSFGNTTAGLY